MQVFGCAACAQIDEDLVARVSLFDYKFSFYQRSKIYVPAWLAPEGIQTYRNRAISLICASTRTSTRSAIYCTIVQWLDYFNVRV